MCENAMKLFKLNTMICAKLCWNRVASQAQPELHSHTHTYRHTLALWHVACNLAVAFSLHNIRRDACRKCKYKQIKCTLQRANTWELEDLLRAVPLLAVPPLAVSLYVAQEMKWKARWLACVACHMLQLLLMFIINEAKITK